MDQNHFDELTRSVASGIGTRRQALRALGGALLSGALGGVAAHLHLAEPMESRARKHQPRKRPDHHPRREPLAHQQPKGVQIAGKGKGKGKHKHHQKKPRNPAPPPPSTDPEPQLCDAYCSDEGGRCCHGECIDKSMCCYPEERTCADGSCWPADGCCYPEERPCGAAGCIPSTQCCPDERSCPNGGGGSYPCAGPNSCCRDEKSCGQYGCVARGQCCPDEKPCYGGCIAAETCCPSDPWPECSLCDEVVCDSGAWVCQSNHDCPPGGKWNPDHCRCDFCQMDCDPVTHMCHATGCKSGEWCAEGQCGTACTEDPRFPQLCCAKDNRGEVICYCDQANEICFWCGSGVCACVPGESPCCTPEIHGPFCPAECRCPA